MVREIISIDEEKCSGCGLCARACHEGAIAIVDGKARLIRDDYCDGMGSCLPECPTGAISFTRREAAAYDPAAVAEHLERRRDAEGPLANWPIQIKLAPVKSPYFDDADLLIAADCAGYACPGFRGSFMAGRTVLIACPKLDGVDYSVKLTEILLRNRVRSVTLARMEVPCCGGLERAVSLALEASGSDAALRVVTVGIDGRTVKDEEE